MTGPKRTVHALGVLSYLLFAIGVVVRHLPIDRLSRDLPIVSLGVGAVLLLVYVLAVELVADRVSPL